MNNARVSPSLSGSGDAAGASCRDEHTVDRGPESPAHPSRRRSAEDRCYTYSIMLDKLAGRLFGAHERREWTAVKEVYEQMKDLALKLVSGG